MEVKLSNIKLVPDLNSVCRMKISDARYFSSEFSDYLSNSRLKLINPDQHGSPSKYKIGFTGETTTSLSIGSSIHELFLQPEDFVLGPDLNKPTAKLGLVIDKIYEFRQKNYSIHDSIIEACKAVHYYENKIDKCRIKSIIKSGLQFYLNSKVYRTNGTILLSQKERSIVENCIQNLHANKQIMSVIKPTDLFGDAIDSYNEDAFFININGAYEDKTCVIKVKMKADNWTIDTDNKIVTLNDLKTTGHLLCQFMKPGGSMETFRYARQFSMYLWILLRYCEKEYGYNPEEWTVKCNVIVVETTADNRAGIFTISQDQLDQGRKEFCKLLKMVAYCEMHDYSDDIIFI